MAASTAAAARRVGGRFAVDVDAKKRRADGAGREAPARVCECIHILYYKYTAAKLIINVITNSVLKTARRGSAAAAGRERV